MLNNNSKSESSNLNLIDEVLKIDKIAQEKLLQEKKLEKEMIKKINKEKQDISTKLKREAEQQLEKLKAFEQEKFKNDLNKLKQTKEQLASNLKHIYEKNETEWIKSTISETINKWKN